MSTHRPLEGIKVIELASVLAGPSVGTFLAELGATVLKIENPKTGGDTTRNWRTGSEDPGGISAYYSSANWGKEVWFLDLSEPSDLKKLNEQLDNADVLLVNFKPGDDLKFNLDYKSVKKLNNKIIVGSIQGFPESSRPAFDIVLQAESGLMALNGTESPGLKWPLPIVDILAAHQLKEGILVALLDRVKSGCGALVSVSLFEAALASLYNVAGNVLMGGLDPQVMGRLHPNIAPYGESIQTSDSINVVLAVGTDQQFQELCEALAIDEEIRKKFSTNSARLNQRNALEIILREAGSKLSFSELESEFIRRKIPFGRVKTLKQVLDEQGENAFLTQEIEGFSTVRMRTAIFKIEH